MKTATRGRSKRSLGINRSTAISTTDRRLGAAVLGLLLAAALLPGMYETAAAEDPIWVRQLGTSEHESSYGVAADPGGNIFIGGGTNGSLGAPLQGGLDAWIAKYDPDGMLLWKQQTGTVTGPTNAFGVAADAEGNAFLVGNTVGSYGGADPGGDDFWVAKYNPDGSLLWTRQLGSAGSDYGYGVATDASGNVLIAGLRGGTYAWAAKFDTAGNKLWQRRFSASYGVGPGVAADGSGNVLICGGGYADVAFVAKTDPDGHLLWKRRTGLGGRRENTARAVATDGNDNVFVAGRTNRATYPSTDPWVAKYDAQGNLLWSRLLGPTGWHRAATGVAADGSGGVFVTGYTGYDTFVAKYDAAGQLLWTKQLGTSAEDISYGVAADGSGDVVISGYTYGSLDGPNQGGLDAFVAKFSGD